MRTASARLAALLSADAVALVVLVPDPRLLGLLGSPRAWVAQVGADTAAAQLAAALLWLAACWLGVGLAGVLAAAAPGTGGRAAARIATLLLPRAVARLVAGASGLGLLLAPVAATASTPAAAPTVVSAPAPAWPTDDALPPPSLPISGPTSRSISGPPPGSATPGSTPREVVVKPGDTLWSIAARHLPSTAPPARIARSWPRWFAANRAVIGADPDLIVAGQVLTPPTEEATR